MAHHSKLGASGAHRWLNCPGSVKLCEDAPPSPSSKYAAEGTVAHAVGEWCLERADRIPSDLLGYWGDDKGRLFETYEKAKDANPNSDLIFEVTDEMCEAVEIYREYVRSRVEEHDMLGEDPALAIELGFDLSFVRPGMFGTNDACIFIPGERLYVVDYKHGRGKVVEVEDNPQLMYYALGALREFCWDKEAGDWNPDLMPRDIILTVVQPRAKHTLGPVREWPVDPTYITEDFFAELKDGADRTQAPNAELRPGDWCTFCDAKAICPALQAKVQEDMEGIFDDMEFEDDEFLSAEDAKKAAKRKVMDFSEEPNERLSQILQAAPLVEEFFAAVASLAQSRLEAGEQIEGYKLVRRKSQRRYKDAKKAEKELLVGFDEEDIFAPRKLKSPAQLEKILGEDVVSQYVEKPDGKLTVAEETDTRPGIIFDPFEGVVPDESES